MPRSLRLSRRALLRASVTSAALSVLPTWARGTQTLPLAGKGLHPVSGDRIELAVEQVDFSVDGRAGYAVAVNGTIPGPLIRLREGQTVTLAVRNGLDNDTSVHWHGLLLPFQFDGVPGVSFPGIAPGETFEYKFPLRQAGTYWWHSHSGLQEGAGHYGPLIIDPAQPDPIGYDREYVILLSDWSPLPPHAVMRKLKQQGDYFNYQRNTTANLLTDDRMGLRERLQWGEMRMSPNDIADVTGSLYRFLVNGHGFEENWTGLFKPGERVRLRFINGAAMTIFNVRIPGLPMTVVQVDGQNVQPVETDEFQLAVAETLDVVIQPNGRAAYSLVAEALDRSGMARATLTSQPGLTAPVPALRKRVLLSMADMGMDHGSPTAATPGDHAAMGHGTAGHGAIDHPKTDTSKTSRPKTDNSKMDHATMDHSSMDHSSMNHAAIDHSSTGHSPKQHAATASNSGTDSSTAGPGQPGHSGGHADHSGPSHNEMSMRDPSLVPPDVKVGVGVDAIAPMPRDRMGDRPLGLEDAPHRVLRYTDLIALTPNVDQRPPSRELEIHLTGNMERYMWSFDGLEYAAVTDQPIRFAYNERVRVKLVNNTMMVHPIHLHGHFFELVNGHPGHQPLKHTLSVMPGGTATFDLTANEPGDWAFHCHLLYHMHSGMFQVVTVRPLTEPLS